MVKVIALPFSLEDLCHATELSADIIIEIVEQGIVEPVGESPENWTFNTQMITVTKKAFRLHKDLDIDWSGIALAISLIDELELLRAENQRLQQRLNRFSHSPENFSEPFIEPSSEPVTTEQQHHTTGDNDE